LLYISPVVPGLTGNGLAMRAGAVLEVLAARYDVYLLVARKYAPFTDTIPEPLEKLCRRAAIVSARVQPRRWLPVRIWRDVRFDVVHVFRLAMVPFSQPYLRGLFRRPRRHLDLDDIESLTGRRLAALYRHNGDDSRADREEAEAARQEEVETATFRSFDRVYVCSAADRRKLEGRARAELRVLPNAVRLPAAVPAAPVAGTVEGPFTFLFAGTLGYYPNEDAVRFLCAEIVPRLRALAGDGFVLQIAGTGGSAALRQAADVPQVRWIGEVPGEVPDLATWYAGANAIVAPLRAGGGTRIKVLEAFSYRRPVVATTLGMEGIEARAEEHVLIGDTPEEIARHCARLIADQELRETLARNAYGLLLRHYTIDALIRSLNETDR
jgi:glycosyltransferase involved in cell wall biosynthesis